MSSTPHAWPAFGQSAYRILMAACLTLTVAILWGEARSQSIQGVMHGLPLRATEVLGVVLLGVSLICWRRLGRLAAYGLAVAVATLMVGLLPTV